MAERFPLPLTVVAFRTGQGVRELPSDDGWARRELDGVHTVTLTARRKWGDVSVTATADGPDGEAAAGWQAFWRLMLAEEPTSAEEWHRAEPGAAWTMGDVEHGESGGG